MRSMVTVIAICFLVGCTATMPVSLYQTYSDYSTRVNADNVVALAPEYFSASLLSAELNDNSVKQQLLFKNLMAEPLQHAELVVGNSGCLAVVGKDSEQQPVQFNLGYRFEANKWLIDQVDVVFLEQLTELGSIGSCNTLFAG